MILGSESNKNDDLSKNNILEETKNPGLNIEIKIESSTLGNFETYSRKKNPIFMPILEASKTRKPSPIKYRQNKVLPSPLPPKSP